ncbi:MAG: hypothetical protein PHC75_06990 [Burkholderiales bacterium]|nr:hypothetical protein [Burkholderiales bacterium]
MKKLNLLSMVLISTLATTSLTSCNNGGNTPPTKQNSNSLLKKISASSLDQKLKNLANMTDEEKILLINEISATQDYPYTTDLQVLYRSYLHAIMDGEFGANYLVQKNIASNIDIFRKSKFLSKDPMAISVSNSTYPDFILTLIEKRILGHDLEIQKTLVSHLVNSNIISHYSYYRVLTTIKDGYYGNNYELTTMLLKYLDNKSYQLSAVQQELFIQSIDQNRFDLSQNGVNRLASYMHKLYFDDFEALDKLHLLLTNKFNNNKEMSYLFAKSLIRQIDLMSYDYGMYGGEYIDTINRQKNKNELLKFSLILSNQNMYTEELKRAWIGALISIERKSKEKDNAFLNLMNQLITKDEAQQLFTSYIVTNDIKESLIKKGFSFDKYQFGNLQEFNTNSEAFSGEKGVITISGNNKSIKVRIQNYLNQAKNMEINSNIGYGGYSVTYDAEGNPDLLIVLAEGVNDKNINNVRKKMQAFLITDPKFKYLYDDVVESVRVYDLKNPSYNKGSEIALLMNNTVSKSSKNYARFPFWLQKAIFTQEFNADDYKYNNLINFTFSLMELLPENTAQSKQLKETVFKAIKYTIKNSGDKTIFSNKEDELKVKNKLNVFMSKNLLSKSADINALLNKLWPTISFHDKFRLLLLCSTLAGENSLGYNNQANEFYYKLSNVIAEKMSNEPIENDISYDFRENLTNVTDAFERKESIERIINKLNHDATTLTLWQRR